MSNELAAIYDDAGSKVIIASELNTTVKTQQSLDKSNPEVERVLHLTSEVFKGTATLPNKTIEVVFSPEIQSGLNTGEYKLLTSGEKIFAEVKGADGKFVKSGKGQLVETGKAKQIFASAFQLLSIAVAQSHLEDINQNLEIIKHSLERILENIESNARSEIRGAIAYIKDFIEFIEAQNGPENIPSAKKMKLEDICYDFKKWRDSVFSEMTGIINKIKNQKDIDRIGTGDTYSALRDYFEDAKILTERFALLLKLATMFNILAAYLDPQKKQFSRVDPKLRDWGVMISNIEEFGKQKVESLLRSSIFNQSETLTLRRQNLVSELERQRVSNNISERDYLESAESTDLLLSRIIDQRGNMRLAISYGSTGAVENVGILPPLN